MTKYPCHICKSKTTKQLFQSIDESHTIPICKHHSNHREHGMDVVVMTKKMTKKVLFAYSKKMHKFHRNYNRKKKFLLSMNDLAWMQLENKPCNFIQNNNIKATMLPYEYESYSKINNTTITWQYLTPLDDYIRKQQNEYSYLMKKHWFFIFSIVLRRFPNRVKNLIMTFANLQRICIVDHSRLMRDCKEYILNTCTRRLSNLAIEANSELYYNHDLRQKFIREAWNGIHTPYISIGHGLRLNAHSVPVKKFKLIYN